MILNMKKAYLYTLAAVIASTGILLTSCSDDDEVLVASDPEINYFEIPASVTGPEADLRRTFLADNGVYLLFNDTLYKGVDSDGYEKVETVDFKWDLTGFNSTDYIIELFDTFEDKKSAAECCQKYVMSHLSSKDFKPYSILLANSIIKDDSKKTVVSNISTFRCLGINAGAFVNAADESELKAAAAEALYGVLESKLPSTSSDERLAFYAVSEEYLNRRITKFISDWVSNPDITRLYEYGIITYEADEDGDVSWDYTWSKANDFTRFLKIMLSYSRDEFYAIYGDYPLVMERYEILYNYFVGQGYIF